MVVRMRGSPALVLALAACTGGQLDGGVYRDGRVTYRVGTPGPRWRPMRLKGADVAYQHEEGGAFLAHGTCPDTRDLSLDVLTNQAQFGLERRSELSRQKLTLDGRAALRTRVTAELDGVPVELDLVVMKRNQCTFDFQLVAARDVFPARDEDFWRFVTHFQELGPQG